MAPHLVLALVLPLAVLAPGRPGGPVPGRLAQLEAREFTLDRAPSDALLTPLQREVQAVLDSMRVRREHLMDEVATPEELPAALARLKRDTRLEILGIQERHALHEGRFALARSIRTSLEELRRDGGGH
jgi:hypothetical protein